MHFEKLSLENRDKIAEMSVLATEIVREHYDPILGKEQNDYMLKKFQSEEAISEQLKQGYQYYFVVVDGINLGFLAFYPREGAMYLSKLYLYPSAHGKGYSRQMLDLVKTKACEAGLNAIELNVNRHNYSSISVYEKLGFQVLRTEKIDIGGGYFMDDYVYRLTF